MSAVAESRAMTAGLYSLAAICIAGYSGVSAARRSAARALAALAAVAVLILGIFQTGSRGGLMVFVAGVLGLVLCGDDSTRKRRAAVGSAVLAVLAAGLLREFHLESATASRLLDAWEGGDTAGRTGIFRAAWGMFVDKPLLGYGGINNLFALGGRLNYASQLRATHNLYLNMLTEVGLVGAIPFFAAILHALWAAWRWGRRAGEAAPFAMMCAVLVFNTSISGADLRIFWIVLAAAAGCGLQLEASKADARRAEGVDAIAERLAAS